MPHVSEQYAYEVLVYDQSRGRVLVAAVKIVSPAPPATYAVSCRGLKVGHIPRFESWAYPWIVGQTLPTLPLWLTPDLAVSLDLETSYEDACRALRLV